MHYAASVISSQNISSQRDQTQNGNFFSFKNGDAVCRPQHGKQLLNVAIALICCHYFLKVPFIVPPAISHLKFYNFSAITILSVLQRVVLVLLAALRASVKVPKASR